MESGLTTHQLSEELDRQRGSRQEPVDNASTNHSAEALDTSLVPKSREIYASKGVEIQSIGIETPDSQPLNQIPFRAAFQLRFRYAAAAGLPQQALRCGCHIASTQGLRVTGQAFPSPGDRFTAEPSQCWELVFSFGPGLLPGVYFGTPEKGKSIPAQLVSGMMSR